MKTQEDYVFRLENDPTVFGECAKMMAASDPWTTLQMTCEQCLAAFNGECKEIYILEKDRQIAGFVILQMCGTFRGYIQTLFVSEPFRGKGLSKMLLVFCEERILKVSPNIFICVSSFNEIAKKIYLDYGFRQVGVLDNFIKKGFDEILLRKSVSPILR
ncbi:MAG: GNAT family N-acetyltransferase [Bacteroidetes bacterium]|nr:GNAT family N-acetyltransferase [Bacteroidota bacterium]